MRLIWEAIKRTLALVGTEVATIMAAGSAMKVDAWKAAVMAALSAVMTVWAAIGRSYYKDGNLTEDEVNDAFNQEK